MVFIDLWYLKKWCLNFRNYYKRRSKVIKLESKWSDFGWSFEDLEGKDTHMPVFYGIHARVCVHLNHQGRHGAYTPVCEEKHTEHAQHTPVCWACVFIWRQFFFFIHARVSESLKACIGRVSLKSPLRFCLFASFANLGRYLSYK